MKMYFWRTLPLALALTACSKVYTPTPYTGGPANSMIRPMQTGAMTGLTSAQVFEELKSTLKKLNTSFKDRYALAEYKKTRFQLDLDAEMNKVLELAQKQQTLSVDTAQRLVAAYVESMRDGHAKVLFGNRPYASLDISVGPVDGKMLITEVSKNCIRCGVQVGDEVLGYEGLELAAALKNLTNEDYATIPGRDLREQARRMTERYGFFGEPVPQPGAQARFLIRNARGNKVVVQLPWKLSDPKSANLNKSRYGVDSQRGHVLKLSNRVWESDKDSIFSAWIGQDAKGTARVGYLRIAAFRLADAGQYSKAISDLEEIITKMNSDSDVLIVDTTEARGTEVPYVYGIASHFLTDNYVMPTFRFRVTKDLVKATKKEIETLEKVDSDPSARLVLGGAIHRGLMSSQLLVKDMIASKRSIVDAGSAGDAYTAFIPYLTPGVASAPIHYSNPMIVLTDAGSAGGAELFASIMQDLKRAPIMGENTAGIGSISGGFIKVKDLGLESNNLGITEVQIPVALGARINTNLDHLENSGVKPDVELGLVEKDFDTSRLFKTYSGAVVKAAKQLVKDAKAAVDAAAK